MKLTSDKAREIERTYFERWLKSEFPNAEPRRLTEPHYLPGVYQSFDHELMWQAWLASRALDRE
jgi:hypothetical protein